MLTVFLFPDGSGHITTTQLPKVAGNLTELDRLTGRS